MSSSDGAGRSNAPLHEGPEALIVRLGDLLERMYEVDAKPIDFGVGQKLHRGELHTVQAIGRRPGLNLTGLAELTGVSKGAASQMVSRLARRGLVRKQAAPGSRREIALELTESGWRGFRAHESLHARMIAAVREHYGDEVDARSAETIPVVEDLVRLVERYARMLRG